MHARTLHLPRTVRDLSDQTMLHTNAKLFRKATATYLILGDLADPAMYAVISPLPVASAAPLVPEFLRLGIVLRRRFLTSVRHQFIKCLLLHHYIEPSKSPARVLELGTNCGAN